MSQYKQINGSRLLQTYYSIGSVIYYVKIMILRQPRGKVKDQQGRNFKMREKGGEAYFIFAIPDSSNYTWGNFIAESLKADNGRDFQVATDSWTLPRDISWIQFLNFLNLLEYNLLQPEFPRLLDCRHCHVLEITYSLSFLLVLKRILTFMFPLHHSLLKQQVFVLTTASQTFQDGEEKTRQIQHGLTET